MPKNIFFVSFLYVFIACTFFIASIVHSTTVGEDMAPAGPVGRELQESRSNDINSLCSEYVSPACIIRR